jgi:hypothetical protein
LPLSCEKSTGSHAVKQCTRRSLKRSLFSFPYSKNCSLRNCITPLSHNNVLLQTRNCTVPHCKMYSTVYSIELLLRNLPVIGARRSKKRLERDTPNAPIDISHYRLLFGFSLLYTDRVPFELLDSAALL